MGRRLGSKEGSHSNGKGPMPAECPGDCALLKRGCHGAHQLTSGQAPLGCTDKACGFIKRKDGKPCRQFKMKGQRYCWSHRKYNRTKRTREKASCGNALKGLPMFYSKVLGRTLQSRVEEALEMPSHELLSAREELALVRDQCRNVVQLYAGVVEAKEQGLVSLEDVVKAGGLLNEACAFVIEQVEKVQRIESQSPDKVPVLHLANVVAQLVRLMWECCGEEHEVVAKEFERRVREEVRLPKSGEASEKGSTSVNVNVLNVTGAQVGDSSAMELARSLGATSLLIDGAEVPVATDPG